VVRAAPAASVGILNVERLAEKLDMKETVMETLLSYLESEPARDVLSEELHEPGALPHLPPSHPSSPVKLA
jgi:hypothetical protein